MKAQGFSRAERLRQSSLITRLFEEGKALHAYPLRMVFLRIGQVSAMPHQALFTASKRHFKKAVTRNLLKRRMREAYRLNRSILRSGDGRSLPPMAIAFMYIGREVAPFGEVQDKIILLLHRLKALHEEVAE